MNGGKDGGKDDAAGNNPSGLTDDELFMFCSGREFFRTKYLAFINLNHSLNAASLNQ